jgi:hypothetical protein
MAIFSYPPPPIPIPIPTQLQPKLQNSFTSHSQHNVRTVQNTEYRIQNIEYRIKNTEFRIQNTEYRIQNTELQNTEYRIQNNTEKYRIQKLMYIKLPMALTMDVAASKSYMIEILFRLSRFLCILFIGRPAADKSEIE